jgi:general secretion pathway protein D
VTTPLESIKGGLGGGARGGGQIYQGPDETGSTSAVYNGTDRFTNAATWQPTMESSGDGGITLNLVDASIADAAKAILGDGLGASYVIDPAVTGTITLQTARPLPIGTLVAILEEALRAKGAVLIEAGGFYKIVQAGQAAASARISTDSETLGAAGGEQVQVVPLNHVAAAEMAEILKPLVPQGAIRRVDPERNLLVLAGNGNDIANMLETIDIFDADWMAGKSFGLYKLEHADPVAVVNELEAVFSSGEGGAGKGLVRFIPNRSLSSVLVVAARRHVLDRAAAWIRRVDAVGGSNDRRLYIYRIQNRPARELADILQKIYLAETRTNGDATLEASVAARAPDAAPSAGADSATGFEGTGPAIATNLNGAGAGSAEPVSLEQPAADAQAAPDPVQPSAAETQERPRADISVVADEANNALLIMAKPTDYEKVLSILEHVDMVPNQVLLEATILEVSLNDELKFGLRWFFEAGNSDFRFSDLLTGAAIPQFPGFSYFLSAANVKLAVNALAAITDVNVVSSPSLMVLDNRKATLQVGDEVPIATQQAVGVVSPGAPIVNAIAFRNTGVILNVTPRVSDAGRVVLDIEQEVSNVVETKSSGIDSPTIQQRKVRTTVSVQDGESLTLGGLIQERNTLDRSQVPIAGDVPILGNLFKSKDDKINRTELLIIITPKVVRDVHQAKAITDEFRRELDLNLRPAHDGPPGRRENLYRLIVR